ncbi:hypothetical protein ACFQX4_27525, partial [Roseomonas sp. GCM10028921]
RWARHVILGTLAGMLDLSNLSLPAMDASTGRRFTPCDEALACMGVAELTQLIKDAEAALARKKRSTTPSWWRRENLRRPEVSRAEPIRGSGPNPLTRPA